MDRALRSIESIYHPIEDLTIPGGKNQEINYLDCFIYW